MGEYFVAIDVGSFSVRSGLFLWNQKILKLIEKCEIKINVFNDKENFYEQSSENIWHSICIATKSMISMSNVDIKLVKGISFDATCSLVALRDNGEPLSVSEGGDNNRNIIMWMDHRAMEETTYINNNDHKVLKVFGGKISVEMQPPKLLWLKKNLPRFMNEVSSLFDLSDYLTFRATGSTIRSLCSVTCKWGFDAENYCWDKSFWECSGLSEICDDDFRKIGNTFCLPGQPICGGLTINAAEELGLLPGILVPGSLIDAYAGILGSISSFNQIVTIAGTSACHMILIPNAIYVNGIWGPFKNVLIPNYYVLEGGQSAAGILLDQVLQFSATEISHKDVMKYLSEIIAEEDDWSSNINNISSDTWYKINELAKNIHINPDFLGNRSPRSNENVRGSIIGVGLDNSAAYISKIYLAVIHGLAYGFKEILAELTRNSINVDSIKVCGGLARNILYLKVLADVSGLSVTISTDDDLVLKGTAMLNILEEINILENNIATSEVLIKPETSLEKFHQKKFKIYLEIVKFQEEIMKNE